MNDMEKMMNVMEAFRSSETCRKLLKYLDEVEEYIDDVIEESVYELKLQAVRDLIIRTNEFNWHHYFKEPSRILNNQKPQLSELDKEVFSKWCHSDSCPI